MVDIQITDVEQVPAMAPLKQHKPLKQHYWTLKHVP